MMDNRTGEVFSMTTAQANRLAILRAASRELAEETGREMVEFQIESLPHKGDPECERCEGNQTVRSYGTVHLYAPCPRCYPDHPQKAQSFKTYLRYIQRGKGWG